jgi:hypothetical protein
MYLYVFLWQWNRGSGITSPALSECAAFYKPI